MLYFSVCNFIFCAVLITLMSTGISSGAPLRLEWPMYQASASHNAVLSVPFPAVRWTVEFPKQINGGLAFDGTSLYVDDFAHELVALDPRTGSVRWRANADDVLMSTPVVADDKVFVGSGTNAVMWDVPDDTLWARPEGNHEYAFDTRTGRMVWEFKTRGEAMPTPVYLDGKLLFGAGDNLVRALDAKTGRLIWQEPLPGIVTMAGAMPMGSKVVIMTSRGVPWAGKIERNHIIVMSAKDGRIGWQRAYGNSDCTPTIADGAIFIESSEDQGNSRGFNTVQAFDAGTGVLRWTLQSAGGEFTSKGSNERAIAGVYDGKTLYQSIPVAQRFAAFDGQSGKVRWMLRTSAPVKMSAVVAGGLVYFGDTDGMFYVVETRSGRVVYQRRFSKGFTVSPPIIVGETLFVATTNELHAIPLADLHG